MQLSLDIYSLTRQFPGEEKFGMISQLRRASSSISANIAEGVARTSKKDRARFIQIAYGSAIEVLNFLILSNKLNYIKEEQLLRFRQEIAKLTNKLNTFHKSLTR